MHFLCALALVTLEPWWNQMQEATTLYFEHVNAISNWARERLNTEKVCLRK